MLVVISPAKTLNWDTVDGVEMTEPAYQKEAMSLARTARQLSLKDLRGLMQISEPLAKLNKERFQNFVPEPEVAETRPAALAFAGDTYQGLEAATLEPDALRYAQDHLRILSGLYGLLRPMDRIQPYRLEMGSRLKTRRGGTLYAYWGKEIAKALNMAGAAQNTDTVVNCASQEYFGAVDPKALKLRVLTPVFLEERNGTAKTVSFFAKKARGAMARYVVENRVTERAALEGFNSGGYAYDAARSEGDQMVFARAYPEG